MDSKWHFVAISVKRNAKATFYVDGQFDGEIPVDSVKNVNMANSYPLHIGVLDGAVQYIKGAMKEVRIYKRALSADEIRTQWETERKAWGLAL